MRQTADDVAQAFIGCKVVLARVLKAPHEAMRKPHRVQNLGVLLGCLSQGPALSGGTGRSLGRRAHQPLGQQRQRDQEQGARGRGPAKHGMQQEDEAEIERHPRHIENGHRCLTRQEAADGIDVAQRLHGTGLRADE
jgi:hypothetical protein